jgi:hypothetical protein
MDAERKARLGARRTCADCGSAFYDLGKHEPACPKCGEKQVPARSAPAKPKRAPRKKAKGIGRVGLQRRHDLEARSENVEPIDDDDESATEEEDLEP